MISGAPDPVLPSLRAVARASGVSPTAVYLHFASQRDLIEAVLTVQAADLESSLTRADDPSAPGLDRFQSWASHYVTWASEHVGAYQLLMETADRVPETAVVAEPTSRVVRHLEHLTVILRPNDPEPEVYAQRVWVCLHGLAILRGHKPNYPWRTGIADEAAAIVATFFPVPARP